MAACNNGEKTNEALSSQSSLGKLGEKEPVAVAAVHGLPDDGHNDENSLHRGLKSRHITMIAIGGALGTGLIIGTYVILFIYIYISL